MLLCVQSFIAVCKEITRTNISTLIVGLVCVVFLYGVKDMNERFKKKLPIPIPGEIIVVTLSFYSLLCSLPVGVCVCVRVCGFTLACGFTGDRLDGDLVRHGSC